MELGNLISEYRKAAGLTIDELVSASGVPRGTLNKIISGDTKSPSLETMFAIANALGKTLNDFAPSPVKKNAPSVSDEDEIELISIYRGLTVQGRDMLIAYGQFLHNQGFGEKDNQVKVG